VQALQVAHRLTPHAESLPGSYWRWCLLVAFLYAVAAAAAATAAATAVVLAAPAPWNRDAGAA